MTHTNNTADSSDQNTTHGQDWSDLPAGDVPVEYVTLELPAGAGEDDHEAAIRVLMERDAYQLLHRATPDPAEPCRR